MAKEAHTTLLLVEDEHNLLNLQVELFSKLGFTVLAAGSGDLAIRLYESNKQAIGLVITDLQMTPVTGEQIIAHIRRQDRELPIILVSGSFIDEDLHTRSKEHIYCLKKPFAVTKVMSMINELLNRH